MEDGSGQEKRRFSEEEEDIEQPQKYSERVKLQRTREERKDERKRRRLGERRKGLEEERIRKVTEQVEKMTLTLSPAQTGTSPGTSWPQSLKTHTHTLPPSFLSLSG